MRRLERTLAAALTHALAAAVLFLLPPSLTWAEQNVDDFPSLVGKRVRLSAPNLSQYLPDVKLAGKWVSGTLLAADSETFVVELGQRRDPAKPNPEARSLSLPRSAVKRIDVSRGRSSRGQAAQKGAWIGAAVGLALSLPLLISDDEGCWVCGSPEVSGYIAAEFGILGAGIGALSGGSERWERVRTGVATRPRTSSLPSSSFRPDGVGVSIAIGF